VSGDHEIVVRRSALPDIGSLVDQLDIYGEPVQLPADFGWNESRYFTGRVGNRDQSFGYSIHPLEPLITSGEESSHLRRYGDHLINFSTGGGNTLRSGVLVNQIVRALVELSGAREVEYGKVLKTRGAADWWTFNKAIAEEERMATVQASPEWKESLQEMAAELDKSGPRPGAPPTGFAEWFALGGKFSFLGWATGAVIIAYLVIVK
jgi:hypothetical protein